MDKDKAYKRYCHLCWLGQRCLRVATKGTFASATNWSGVIGSAALAFLLQRYGAKLMPAESPFEFVWQGLLLIALAWCLIFVVRLLFVAPFTIYRDGEWHGDKFVYAEPKLAFHAYVSPATNNKLFAFKFLDAPPFSLVEYKFDIDAPSNFISIAVMAHPAQCPEFTSEMSMQYTKGGVRVNRQRNMFLRTFVKPDATPFSVRVYITGWVSGPNGSEHKTAEFEPARWG